MKSNKKILLIGILMIIFITSATVIGLGLMSSDMPKDETIYLTYDDNGSKIDLNIGERVNLTLDQNGGSTGYSWNIIELNESILKFENTKTWNVSQLVGGFSKDSWHFTAVNNGTTILKLAYYRSWEGIDNSSKVFEIEINVE
jgi:predicted secreted protein